MARREALSALEQQRTLLRQAELKNLRLKQEALHLLQEKSDVVPFLFFI